jgi:hypothetical protein
MLAMGSVVPPGFFGLAKVVPSPGRRLCPDVENFGLRFRRRVAEPKRDCCGSLVLQESYPKIKENK